MEICSLSRCGLTRGNTGARSRASTPTASPAPRRGTSCLLPCAATVALAALRRGTDVCRILESASFPTRPVAGSFPNAGRENGRGAWSCLALESGNASGRPRRETRQASRRRKRDCMQSAEQPDADCGGKRRVLSGQEVERGTEEEEFGEVPGSGDDASSARPERFAASSNRRRYRFKREWLGGECFAEFRHREILLEGFWRGNAIGVKICPKSFTVVPSGKIYGTFRKSLMVSAELRVLAEFRFNHNLPAIERAWTSMAAPLLRWLMGPLLTAQQESFLASTWRANGDPPHPQRRHTLLWTRSGEQHQVSFPPLVAAGVWSDYEGQDVAADGRPCLPCQLLSIQTAEDDPDESVFFVPELDALMGGGAAETSRVGGTRGSSQRCHRCGDAGVAAAARLHALGRAMDSKLRNALWKRQENGVLYYLTMLRVPPPPPLGKAGHNDPGKADARDPLAHDGIEATCTAAWEQLRQAKQYSWNITAPAPRFELGCVAQRRVCQFFAVAVRMLTSLQVTVRLFREEKHCFFHFAANAPLELAVVTAVVANDLKDHWARYTAAGAWMVRPELWAAVWQRAVAAAAAGPASCRQSNGQLRAHLFRSYMNARQRVRAAAGRSEAKCAAKNAGDGNADIAPSAQPPHPVERDAPPLPGEASSWGLRRPPILPVKVEVFADAGSYNGSGDWSPDALGAPGAPGASDAFGAPGAPPDARVESVSCVLAGSQFSPVIAPRGSAVDCRVKEEPDTASSDSNLADASFFDQESSVGTFSASDVKIEEHPLEWDEKPDVPFTEAEPPAERLECAEKGVKKGAKKRVKKRARKAKSRPLHEECFSMTPNPTLLASPWLRGAFKMAWQVALLSAIDTKNSAGFAPHDPLPSRCVRGRRATQPRAARA